ncbi:hypothetical protein N657DRAFT_192484 [Parathielavia appendiculata]|uniref:Uncharacterized protein n=1 Tax=Parathielavia appendiculata TaxID=2587402 RepID=A0AAN6U611_9PEZI|nr:hypothetical protein N657DRAFT_192484 [Parathielavia appendiculata]
MRWWMHHAASLQQGWIDSCRACSSCSRVVQNLLFLPLPRSCGNNTCRVSSGLFPHHATLSSKKRRRSAQTPLEHELDPLTPRILTTTRPRVPKHLRRYTHTHSPTPAPLPPPSSSFPHPQPARQQRPLPATARVQGRSSTTRRSIRSLISAGGSEPNDGSQSPDSRVVPLAGPLNLLRPRGLDFRRVACSLKTVHFRTAAR